MNSGFFDPHNHVPEVSPDDGWGDAEGFNQTPTAASLLPPRRVIADRPPENPAEPEVGLRIEADVTRLETPDSAQQIEIQELGSEVVRLDQMMPAPSKVERQIKFQQRPASDPARKRIGHHWGIGQQHSVRWIIGSGLGIAGIVTASLFLLPIINAPNLARAGPRQEVLIEDEIDGAEAMNLMLTKQTEASQIFHAFATASQVDEILFIVRDGAALEPVIRSRWQPIPVPKQWSPSNTSVWGVRPIHDRPCGVLQGNFPDGSEFTAYFTNDGNRLLLDWKATTGFGTATYTQLKQGEGEATEIRGEIYSADYYSAVWPEADYQSYRLNSPDRQSTVWCYARRGDAADAKLGPIFRKGEIIGEAEASRKVTLRLERGPADALPNQWLIGELLHVEWVSQ